MGVAGETIAGAGLDARLGQLYARHAADARRLAFLVTGDRAEAEDIVQDAFVRVAGRIGGLRSPDAFPAYLRRAVVNRAHSRVRSARRERDRVERHHRLSGGDAVVPGPEPADEELWELLQRLPQRQRSAVVLRFWLDLPVDGVADVLGCRPGTAKSLLSRGLTTLRGAVHDG